MPAKSRTAEVVEQLPGQVPGFVRTYAPILAAPFAAWLVKKGFGADSNAILLWLIPLMGWAYYTLVRAVEMYFPKFGWLLGIAKQPSYSPVDVAYEVAEVVEVPGGYEVAADADPGRAEEAPASLLDVSALVKTHCLSVHQGRICRLMKHGPDVPHDRVRIT